jgi:hypothetical protein
VTKKQGLQRPGAQFYLDNEFKEIQLFALYWYARLVFDVEAMDDWTRSAGITRTP